MSEKLTVERVELVYERIANCAFVYDDEELSTKISAMRDLALQALAPQEGWVRVPKEFLERITPALKLSYLKASQSVNACSRGELPALYMEALKDDEEAQAELLAQHRAMLSAAPQEQLIQSDLERQITAPRAPQEAALRAAPSLTPEEAAMLLTPLEFYIANNTVDTPHPFWNALRSKLLKIKEGK